MAHGSDPTDPYIDAPGNRHYISIRQPKEEIIFFYILIGDIFYSYIDFFGLLLGYLSVGQVQGEIHLSESQM